ncbi:UNVERIFIED_CONTAM: Non-specific lipid-transfer protein 2 [Sesamum angustifolium]|uniref:Non-specific lipid-transfer protein n=2 Tax=Sesamum TaxID=4181 RepID=A0AAE1X6U0_9LAMI|nr:Non-specific lipid-transfer protein 2 [Sesamum angolense]
MAGIIKPMCIVLIAAILAVAVAPRGEAAIGCGTVVSYLNPCLPYVTNKGPLGSCCSGVKGLYGAAQTTPDRQTVCSCLKSLAGSYKDVDLSKAAGLPGQCGVNIPYKISPSTDCSKVN